MNGANGIRNMIDFLLSLNAFGLAAFILISAATAWLIGMLVYSAVDWWKERRQ